MLLTIRIQDLTKDARLKLKRLDRNINHFQYSRMNTSNIPSDSRSTVRDASHPMSKTALMQPVATSGSGSCGTKIPSLAVLCRIVVTNHLERYTPESFQICDIYEWDEIIQLRHSMTQPNKKLTLLASGNHNSNNNLSCSNDIDGHGRLLPAISEKVLQQIEECNEHLADSIVADTLVWKDCVEYRFKRNVGLLRPPLLFEPWPILVQHIQTHCQTLSTIVVDDKMDDRDRAAVAMPAADEINEAIRVLQSTTWNVALLRDTGIGKIVKRLLKKISTGKKENIFTEKQSIILQQLLSGWMHLANTNNTTGIYEWKEMTTTATKTTTTSGKKLSSTDTATVTATTTISPPNHEEDAMKCNDLQLLEKCLSWRQLYQILEHRKGIIQATQGKRMREIRNNVRTFFHRKPSFFLI